MISVIFTTYNSPQWLQKVLWGYHYQNYKDFEVIIADDGSTIETKKLIASMRPLLGFPIQHIWQEDNGFQKCKILNKAILASRGNYIVISDGDCIPREDFIKIHVERKEKGCFLSGGYFKLPLAISHKINKQDIKNQSCFKIDWLESQGMKLSVRKKLKLNATEKNSEYFNKLTPTKATWNGHNSSGWKDDILAVNGFDERMKYGGQDREMGERLINNGIIPLQIRYNAICVHLEHARGYMNDIDLNTNAAIRRETKRKRKTWTNYGIKK